MIAIFSVGFFIAFIITFLSVPLFKKLALKYNIVDAPDGKLKVHLNTTPYLGGIAIYTSFILAYVVLILTKAVNYSFDYSLIIYLSVLCLVGLVDDIFALSPQKKFFGQILSVTYLLVSYNFFNISNIYLIAAYAFWLLTLINAFNLIDIMDGLAATLAITSASLFFFLSLYYNFSYLAFVLALLLGTLCGFFYYNKPTAQIYLGDSGSLFIGGFLGYISLIFFSYNKSLSLSANFLIIIAFLLIPLLEIISLIIIRTYKGIPFYRGSPDHFAIYLKKKDWPVSKILIYTASVACVSGGLIFLSLTKAITFFTLIVLISILKTIWLFSIFSKAKVL